MLKSKAPPLIASSFAVLISTILLGFGFKKQLKVYTVVAFIEIPFFCILTFPEAPPLPSSVNVVAFASPLGLIAPKVSVEKVLIHPLKSSL